MTRGTASRTAGMRLRFLGANGTVTGSRYLVDHAGHRLLVDCGLFQGFKQLRLRNWAPLPVAPEAIDAVLLTHAHIDHSGYLPRLVAQGFRGRVFATAGTAELLQLLLPDSARLQEEEARYANRHGFSKHRPALPLYTEKEALRALRRLEVRSFGEPFAPIAGLSARFSHAGHILGAASVQLAAGGRTLGFSGDLGRADDPVMKPPAAAPAADVVVVESTYGDRLHPAVSALDPLADAISRTAARGGVVIVPAFAVGRAQTLLHLVLQLKARGRIPALPLYLNSPMAADVTALLQRHADEHRLSAADLRTLAAGVRIVNSEEESRALNALPGPAVIVSASGMATGGRVVHHLKAYAPDRRNTIVLAGHQAGGTRGAALAQGARQLRIHGQWVDVRAEVVALDGLSSHADRDGLLAWLGTLPRPPRRVCVTHGEPAAADALRQAIEERLGWPAVVPEHLSALTV